MSSNFTGYDTFRDRKEEREEAEKRRERERVLIREMNFIYSYCLTGASQNLLYQNKAGEKLPTFVGGNLWPSWDFVNETLIAPKTSSLAQGHVSSLL